jgi:nitroreductase
MDEIAELISTRRSIRFYQPQEVERENNKILLLKAAMSAPNACNSQPWDFSVVTDSSILE